MSHGTQIRQVRCHDAATQLWIGRLGHLECARLTTGLQSSGENHLGKICLQRVNVVPMAYIQYFQYRSIGDHSPAECCYFEATRQAFTNAVACFFRWKSCAQRKLPARVREPPA